MGTAPIDWPNVDAPDWYVPLQEYYKQLWDSGTIDLLVTRFASMGSYFDTHSIRHQYLYPSQETMLETYQDLLHQLDASAMRAAAACVALIDVPNTDSAGAADPVGAIAAVQPPVRDALPDLPTPQPL